MQTFSTILKAIMFFSLSCSNLMSFSGQGSGSEEDPYQISNVNQLQEMINDTEAEYILINDIDASDTKNWNDGKGFSPVGYENDYFTGSFDGNGFVIKYLYINRPQRDYVGLFGSCHGWLDKNRSFIKNVGLIDCDIIGDEIVGGLAGEVFSENITNCFVTGQVEGRKKVGGLIGTNLYSEIFNNYSDVQITGTFDNTGGLVGYNTGTVVESHSSGVINGIKYVGGLVGYNSSDIINSYSDANVIGQTSVGGNVGLNDGGLVSNTYASGEISGKKETGGLIGTQETGTLRNSFANGSIKGSDDVGGLIGRNEGEIMNSYSTALVNGDKNTGGLVGYHYTGEIINSYSNGKVEGNSNSGGLVGYKVSGQSISSFWDIEKSAIQLSALGEGKSSEELKTRETFINVDWDFDQIWELEQDINDAYPYLRGVTVIKGQFSGEGEGTIEAPYQIRTPGQLQEIKDELNAHYILMNDIDALETKYWNSGQGFLPIGYAHQYFTGTLDGNGYKISNLYINRKEQDYTGLFGYAWGANCTFTNICLENCDIDGGHITGGLIAVSYKCSISNSYVKGSVNGKKGVGALIAYNNYGVINNTFTDCIVSGHRAVGGLIGGNHEGSLSDSYALGDVSGSLYIGGLVGENDNGDPGITDCYATGNVNGGDYLGGLIGLNYGSISHSYATGDVTGDEDLGGLVGSNGGTIEHSSASGNVSGELYVGGLIGSNHASISTTSANGSVTGEQYIGGLVGRNSAGIINSYSRVEVSGYREVGGLVGENGFNCDITNCYAAGPVSAQDVYGGLVGYSANDVIASFWDMETTGITSPDWGMPKSTVEMKTKSTFFDAGWDFDSTWSIDDYTNDGYPYLNGVEIITGVAKIEAKEFDVKIYPNPAKEFISIELPENNHVISIQIYDISARLIKTLQIRPDETILISTTDLNSGYYLLKIQTNHNISSYPLFIK